jgi:hypothetical protein
MPYAVTFGAVGAVVAVVFLGLLRISRRKLIAIALVAAVLWLLPLYVLQKGHSFVGEAVQPRYLLPLIIVFVGIALLPAGLAPDGRAQAQPDFLGQTSVAVGRFPLILIGAALVVAQSVALHENMRRYITGVDAIGLNLNHGIEWWWPIGISPMAVWIAGSVAFAALVVILLREIHAGRSNRDVDQVESSSSSTVASA